MAASSPHQRMEDFTDDFLTCAICTELFDNTAHQAKCLPCLHTYCKSCLESLAGKRPKFNCPNCRKLITLPEGIVDSLPNNFIVENLKDYQDIFNFAVSCGSCESGQAVSFCYDCGAFLCQKCVDAHAQLKLLRHKLSTVVELQEQRFNPMMRQLQHCVKHPKQDITMYCRESNCKVPVCATCGHLNHRGHDLIELSAATENVVADLQQSAARVYETKHELICKRSKAENIQKILLDNFSKKRNEIHENAQKLHNQIDSVMHKAEANLKTLYETEMNHLVSSLESINLLIAHMTSAHEFANQACDKTNPLQLLTSHNQIMDRFHELQNSELPDIGSDKTDFAFTDRHYSAMTQVQTSLQHLWKIRVA